MQITFETASQNPAVWRKLTSQLAANALNDLNTQIIIKVGMYMLICAGNEVRDGRQHYSIEELEADIQMILKDSPDQLVFSMLSDNPYFPEITQVINKILYSQPARFTQLIFNETNCNETVCNLANLISHPRNQLYSLSINFGKHITLESIAILFKSLEHPNNNIIALRLNSMYVENLNDDILNRLNEALHHPDCKIAMFDIGDFDLYTPHNTFDDASKQDIMVDFATRNCPCSREALAAIGQAMKVSWKRYSQKYRQAVGEQKMTAMAAMTLAGLPQDMIFDILNYVPPRTTMAYFKILEQNMHYPNRERFRFTATDESQKEEVASQPQFK